MERRICKKCLLYELAESQEGNYVERYRENLSEENRTEEVEYKRRLSICKECDLLLEAMCRSCGCYVEIRAAVGKQHCPYDKW